MILPAPRPGTASQSFERGCRGTRTAATVNHYRRIYRSLIMASGWQASNPLRLLFDWLQDQHYRWSPATIRAYHASIHQFLEDLAQRGRISIADREYLSADLAQRPRPLPWAGPARCSAKKRKSVKVDELNTVRAFLKTRGRPDDRLLADLLLHGAFLALRPCEWSAASLRRSELRVRNAKATNGRACGESRTIHLGEIYRSPRARESLSELTDAMRDRLGSSADQPYRDRRRVLCRLGARLRRACRSENIKPIALYTLRHAAIATLKRSLSPAEVAAMAGHASDRTAGRHYGRRHSGWDLPTEIGRPSGAALAQVRISGRAVRTPRAPHWTA